MVIDAHHHLWMYDRREFAWISNAMEVLQADFAPDGLQRQMKKVGVEGAISVQARQSIEETRWLLEIAGKRDFIRGVVGWVPLVDPNVASYLERLAPNPKLKGVRHVVQDEADDHYILRDDFNRGVAQLKRFNLRYDILIFERHFPQTIQFVDRHPEQVFVLDHIGKPKIRRRAMSPWRENMKELARRENVYCKLSGMVTEANWKTWTPEKLRPYFDATLEAFGPSRLMFGSDWPVCLLASDYQRWTETARGFTASLSPAEQAAIFGGTASKAYNLET